MPSGDSFPRLAALVARAREQVPSRVAVAFPCSDASLLAALDARDARLIEPVLVGPAARIRAVADAAGTALDGIRVVDTPDDPVAASRAAVALAAAGEVTALMKGSQHTDELLAAVVARDANMRTGRRISHVFWFDLPAYHKPLMLTDCVVNIAPGLSEKVDILRNAVGLAHGLGVICPKVALLSAVETVNPALTSSTDAALLCKMADRNQLGGPVVVDGPFGFDNAFSAEAAATKGIASEVAGDADILLVHGLDVGNALYKSFVYAGGGECAGVVLGARVPVILTSRAESRRARVASCALALFGGEA